jgi:2-polyprenyl-3-methyl-5-hydroxy-6-metoxy-1,4-benzoquinol methylase
MARPAPDGVGYVELQRTPYRGHQLVIDTVVRHSTPGDWVFEGGVSSGYVAAELVARGLKVDGAEIDPAAADAARAHCDTILVGDLQTLDLTSLRSDYRVLLFADTVEHIPDPAALLKRVRPRLRPDGALILSVPNIANWAMRLGLLFGRFRYTDRGILDRTHLRFFTKKTLVELVESSGYRVTDVTASVPVPGLSWGPLCALAHRVGNLWPSLFAYTFVVTAVPA